ncbi:orf 58 [Ateline gammaherpesvirus 3]|uniref:Orf 58 n=1 Tax=Ateline herpesvirus 3 TaxID=85618 RepID=Q9YTK9_ATHV3|nr:orf 58 [Ateline gammaherpesvirus 3]AAC95582.1 orf 58 [Ateline gammaherpesvirus 3]
MWSYWILNLRSLCLGALAATPFIWCFIFKSLFTFSIFTSWQLNIFYWAVFGVHVTILGYCYITFTKQWSYYIEALGITCFFVTMLTFFISHFKWASLYTLPFVFVLNCIFLSLWVPITYDIVYLCPFITYKYYELGFLNAMLFYYWMVANRMYVSGIFMCPFVLFLGMGIFALKNFYEHPVFEYILLTCKPIFTENNKYKTNGTEVNMKHVFYNLGAAMFLLAVEFATLVSILQRLDIFVGMQNYLFLLFVSMLCCCVFSVPSNAICIMVETFAVVIIIVIHVLINKIPVSILGGLVVVAALLMCQAIGCQIEIRRTKLVRDVGGPKLCLILCTICNIVVSVALMCCNKSEQL